MTLPSTRTAIALAIAIVALHLVAAGCLAWISPWTPDERGYLASGRSLVLGAAWEVPEQRFQGPLGLLANQIFIDSAALDPLAPDDAKFAARLGMLVFPLLLLIAIGAWTWQAFGAGAALLALFLAAVNPTLLAFGHLLAVDTALTALTVVTFWATWRWLTKPSGARIVTLGVAIGGLLATKYTSLLLVPAVPLCAAVAVARGADLTPFVRRNAERGGGTRILGAGAALMLVAIIAVVTLHCCYLLRAPNYDTAQVGELTSGVLRAVAAIPGGAQLLGVLPEPFVIGADYQAAVSRALGGTFLDYDHSHWAYYSTSLLSKTPLALLGLWLLALIARPRIPARFAGLCLGTPAVILLAYMSLASSLQMGIRYLLPIVPLMTIRAGAFVASDFAHRTAGRVVLALGCAAALLAAVATWPCYIGYFNLAVGGPAGGYRLFADVNCDWYQRFWLGQDVLRARHDDLTILRVGEGPRASGKIAVYTIDLKPSDPENRGRTYHWITRFPIVDNYAAAWLVFDVTIDGYQAAARAGDTRAARDLAYAFLRDGEFARARGALELATSDSRTAALLETIDLLERAHSGDADARREAITRLSDTGQAELAMRFLGDAPREDLPQLFVLMARAGRFPEAIAILDNRAADGPLLPIEALLLGTAKFWQGDIRGAWTVMQRGPAPPEDDPLSASWKTVYEQVKTGAESLDKLQGTDPKDK